jgi:tetratricopeptide (TPR) repeat protein
MKIGDVVLERFEIQGAPRRGGHAEVFRALDRHLGTLVAIKVLARSDAGGNERFRREAAILQRLEHPNLVRYVAAGDLPDGRPFLITEWLEGEDLYERLLQRERAVTYQTVIDVGVAVADALSHVHPNAVVHRDLTPRNIFLLADGSIKLIDFGIAYELDQPRLTSDGGFVGTRGYHAPEQAQPWSRIDSRADLFSLGAVLFEMIAGRPAFSAESALALDVKILQEDPEDLGHLVPDVPKRLSALVGHMLQKDPAMRPQSAGDVAEQLRDIRASLADRLGQAIERRRRVGGGGHRERRWVCILLLGPIEPREDAEMTSLVEHVRQVAEGFGGDVRLLRDRCITVKLTPHGGPDPAERGLPSAKQLAATDRAALGAKCATEVRRLVPSVPMSLAISLDEAGEDGQVAQAIDRAAGALPPRQPAPPSGPLPIALDDTTAALLETRYHVEFSADGTTLGAERDIFDVKRTLLGASTHFLGRKSDLAELMSAWRMTLEDGTARAVLVYGEAGIGKSRLAQEIIQRVQHGRHGNPLIWMGRCEPLLADSSYAVLRDAMRRFLGIRDNDPDPVRRDKLLQRVRRSPRLSDAELVSEMLGELMGIRFPDESRPHLRAARQDPSIMGPQVQRAWLELLRSETSTRAILFVLDDLHWGDQSTVKLIDTALGDSVLKGRPWMVLALARPEVDTLFPTLWRNHRLNRLPLGRLGDKDSEKLIRHVLKDVGENKIAEIIRMADGNVFYLEELIRAVGKDSERALPDSLMAMTSARLDVIPDESLSVLCSASVFGERFWLGGVAAVLGVTAQDLELPVADLVSRELIHPVPTSTFAEELEYAFQHDIPRVVAHRRLSSEDRRRGHLRAGCWLADKLADGAESARMLAEHFKEGGALTEAAGYSLRVAEQHHRMNESEAAIRWAREAVSYPGIKPEDRLELAALLSEAHGWRNEWAEAAGYVGEVMAVAASGGATWIRVVPAALTTAAHLRDLDSFRRIVMQLLEQEPSADAMPRSALAFTAAIYLLNSIAQFGLASMVLDRLVKLVTPIAASEHVARGWMELAHSAGDAWGKEDFEGSLRRAEAGREGFRTAGHRRGELLAQVFVGMGRWFLGCPEAAEVELRGTMVADEEFGPVSWLRTYFLAQVLLDLNRVDEAGHVAEQMLAAAQKRQMGPQECLALLATADVKRDLGHPAEAVRELEKARKVIATPLDELSIDVSLARSLRAAGDLPAALAAVERAVAGYQLLGAHGFRGALASLVHAECLLACGREREAFSVAEGAHRRVLANAEKIRDAPLKASFLSGVRENAAIARLVADLRP